MSEYVDILNTRNFITTRQAYIAAMRATSPLYMSRVKSELAEVQAIQVVLRSTFDKAQDRQLCKGVRGEQRIPTHKLFGFRKFDKVRYLDKEYFIKGRRSVGTCTLMDIFNQAIDFSHMLRGWKTPKLTNCKRITARTSCLIERRSVIPMLS